MRLILIAAFLSVFQLFGLSAQADPFGLAIEGRDGGGQVMSLAELDQMPQQRFTTSTIWTDAPVAFSGVPLRALVGELRPGQTLRLIALNDYQVDLPTDALKDDLPIVATRMDGRVMAVRDKGPFWVVYPYDSDSALQNETTYARSVWQLKTIRIIDGS
ncbi:MAG: oxidoreductase [Silicimonas sp.]|nr:oxidoreductase [Silicimonas sp.]